MDIFDQEAILKMVDEGGICESEFPSEISISENTKKQSLENLRKHVKGCLWGEPHGNDYLHCERVSHLAKLIAEKEFANVWYCQMLGLLHGICDFDTVLFHKQTKQDIRKFLVSNEIPIKIVNHLIRDGMEIVWNNSKDEEKSLEVKCVIDADSLESIGAIGIARCFASTGFAKRAIYNPGDMYTVKTSKKNFDSNIKSAIWQFYNCLLHVKDKMITATGKKLAKSRHNYMENFLNQFFADCEEYTISGGL